METTKPGDRYLRGRRRSTHRKRENRVRTRQDRGRTISMTPPLFGLRWFGLVRVVLRERVRRLGEEPLDGRRGAQDVVVTPWRGDDLQSDGQAVGVAPAGNGERGPA